MRENKQKILDLLLPALQATSNLSDILSLIYDSNTEIVTACFESGTKRINVTADSGTAMIEDVIKHIV